MTTPQRNNDVYNHPQSEDEMNQQVDLNKQHDTSNNQQERALNPNPRANENLPAEDRVSTEESTNQAGSEITDGEAG